jgi:hypothetical protein
VVVQLNLLQVVVELNLLQVVVQNTFLQDSKISNLLHSTCLHIQPYNAELTIVIIIMNIQVTIFALCTIFQSCCTLIIQSPYTYINQGLIHMNKTGFAQKTESHYEVLQMTNFLMLSQHINLSPEQHLTECCAI